ncbi:hypothetical protein [Devosia sp.]|uniref:hypothetical protein n=1 Tax=Devosia sp. TaxID=1871048 RepID=UPI003BAD6816
MVRPSKGLMFIALAMMFSAASASAQAADMAATTPLPASADVATLSHAYLDRKAVLLQLRVHFDTIEQDDAAQILAQDAKAIAKQGPSLEASSQLDTDLLAEGSYYIVSLKYLIEAGGAVWPTDRAEATYVNDALARLNDLQAQLVASVADGTDPLAVFLALDGVNAWTEGYTDVPADLDFFSGRDALVDAALEAAKPVGT